jgi:iron(III) transport system permease protein
MRLLAGLLGLAALFPIFLVLLRGVGAVSLDAEVLLTTVGLVGIGTSLTLFLGTGLALLCFRAQLPRWVDVLVLLPYLLPPFIGATAWLAALGAGNPFTGSTIINLYGWTGIVLAWTTHYTPLAYLMVRASLEAQSASYEQAARVHGLSAAQTLWRVTLPLARPGLISAGVLVALSLLGNFGVPAILGFPAKVYTLATLSYARLLNPTLSNALEAASGVAVLLCVLALPALWLRSGETNTTPSLGERAVAGRKRAWLGVGGWFFVSSLIPLTSILILAFKPAYQDGVTLEHFQTAFGLVQVQNGIRNSLVLALLAALLTAGLGVLLAYSERRNRLVAWLNRAIGLSYLLPGTILALGFILAYGSVQGFYATPWILFAAYVLRFLTPALQAARSGLEARGQVLEFAARVHGLPAGQAFLRVVLPLLRPYIVAAMLAIYPLALAEITLSSILYAPGAETIGVAVLGLLNEGNLRAAAAVASVVVLLSLPALWVLRRP